MEQESKRQRTIEDTDGRLHPAVDEQSLGERWTVCSGSLESQRAKSMMPIRFSCARRLQCPDGNLSIVVCSKHL